PNTLKEEEFVYDPRGKRDPFRPFNLNLRIVNDGTMTPLEQYTLGQLRVTAIISEKSTGGTAIIEDSAGKGYPVRVGTKVGNLGGVIVSIEPDRVKILETQIDLYGKEKQNLTEMKIHLTKK
ncbi:MAG: pilus assembly protein PilP, partial [Anaerolineales bacterium]|nr:pilus assembly protein PilP [Anaerolineales bacterium]